ncbi:cytospin-A-like isoform X1 [Scleropages formosus]|nr:cytospin-A-like isoform X1 [Scleropages formosus]
MTHLQERFDELKEDFAAHREEAQREAALHAANLEEKQVRLEHLKEVVFELEDEVEQHRAVKLHDNLNIAALEDFVRKLQDEKRDMDREIKALQRKYKDESAEWDRLRADLHAAVVVAGDIACSAKDEVEALRRRLLQARRENDELSRELEEQRNHRAAEERAQVHTHTRDPCALSSGTRPNRWCSTFSSPNVRSLIRSFDCVSQGPTPGPSCLAAASVGTPFSCSPLKSPPAATVYPLQRPCVDGTPPVAHDPSFPTRGVFDKSAENITSTSQVYDLGVAADVVSDVVSSTASPVSSCSREKVQKDVDPHSATVALNSSSRPCSTSAVPVSQGVPREQQTDPWSTLVHRTGESRWNALLRWCQRKTRGYQNIHIKNFSSSWHDGLAFCAILHSYLPKHVPFWELNSQDKRRNLMLALTVTQSIGIKCTLDVDEMMWTERPDWQSVMTYIISVYEYFET